MLVSEGIGPKPARVPIFLSRCIIAIDQDRMHVSRFNAILKKHHLLAIMSAVRLLKSQAMWNLRQVLEAGAHAAFAIANPGDEHLFKWENGLLVLPPKLPGKRYDWLAQNHKPFSDAIKAKKDMLNESQTHANGVAAHGVFTLKAIRFKRRSSTLKTNITSSLIYG